MRCTLPVGPADGRVGLTQGILNGSRKIAALEDAGLVIFKDDDKRYRVG